jgi:hypothetical protein
LTEAEKSVGERQREEEAMRTLRHLETKDYFPILRVANEWWGGRPVAGILLRVFFEHFQPTSFVLEQDGAIQGFLIGFRSQTDPAQAYIHAVGTDPQNRGPRSADGWFFIQVQGEPLCGFYG